MAKDRAEIIMSTSAKKIAANRINGQKSHGPKNTMSTRFNATKHGLLTQGITELDDAEGYKAILGALIRERNPVGALEMFLVESAALDMVRWPRARRLEAECITGELHPPTYSPGFSALSLGAPELLDPGLPAPISSKGLGDLITLQRYESTFANRLFRTLHELERLQRMRQGERLPAPAIVDVNVHSEIGTTGTHHGAQVVDGSGGDSNGEFDSYSTGTAEGPIRDEE
jgi:hypothetical protein